MELETVIAAFVLSENEAEVIASVAAELGGNSTNLVMMVLEE